MIKPPPGFVVDNAQGVVSKPPPPPPGFELASPDWGDLSIGQRMYAGGAKAIGGIVGALGDATTAYVRGRLPGSTYVSPDVATGQGMAESGNIALQEADKAIAGTEPTFLQRGSMIAAQSAVPMAVGLGAGMLAGPAAGAIVAPGIAGISSGATEYGERRAQGFTPSEAIPPALFEGGVEMATEMLPFKFILDPATGSVGRRIAKGFAADAVGEQIASAAQGAGNVLFGAPDPLRPGQDLTLGNYAAEQMGPQAVDTLAASVVMAPLGAGATALNPGAPAASGGPDEKQKLDLINTIRALAPAYEGDAAPQSRPIDPALIEEGNANLRSAYGPIVDLLSRTGTSLSPGVAVEPGFMDEITAQPAQEPPPPTRLNDQLVDMVIRMREAEERAQRAQTQVDENVPVEEIEALPAPDVRLNEPFPPAPPKKGTKVEDISGLLEEIELAPPPQEETLALPPPAMPVDSRGVAATPDMRQSLEERARAAERAGNVEGAIAMRRDAITPDLSPQPATELDAAFELPANETNETPAGTTRLSRDLGGAQNRRGADPGKLQQAFDGLTSSLKGAVPVRVVTTATELPPHIQQKMQDEGAEGVGGVYDGGVVYMVADELPNPVAAARTYFHEQVGHAGLRGLFGFAGTAEARAAFDKLLDDIVAAGRAGKFELYESEFATPREAAEEYIARSSERGARDPAGVMPRVRVMVAQALRRTPVLGKYFKNITQAEIDALLARARRYVEEGGSETQAFRGSRFARGLPGDTRFARAVGTQRLGHDQVLRLADGSWRRNSNGDISGAPPGIKTDDDIRRLAANVVGYMEDPIAQMPESAYWYERSGEEIRRLAKHDKALMEKIVRVMARFSVNAQVGANTTFAVKAAYQIARGEPVISGRFPNVFREEAVRLLGDKQMTLDTPGVNRKVLNFYRNLWDATFKSDKYENAATMDMWMARLYGYNADHFTDAQYRFANYLTQEVTRAYNAKHQTSLKPRMAQAALWTYARASGLDEGADTDFDAKYDFQSYLQRAEQNITWEAVPSASLPGAEALVSAPRDVRERYTKEAAAVTVKGGKDLLMDALRAPLYSTERGRGAFEGAVNRNMVSTLAALKSEKYDRSLADLYAIATLYVHSQDAVPWFQLDPKATNADRGVALEFSKAPSQRDLEVLERALRSTLGNGAFTQAGKRVFIIDFGNAGKGYKKFYAAVEAALDALPNSISGKITKVTDDVKSTGEYHDVKGLTGTGWDTPEAAREGLRREISNRGRPDLLDRLDGWRESVERIRSRYITELGGDGGTRLSRRVGDGRGRDQGRSYPPLEGGPIVEGATGPDPQVVQVAERYAKENGIDLRRQAEYAQVDPARAKRIAAAYEAMPHAPNDPKVKEAYDNLIRQTVAQYRALERAGFKFWFYDASNDPYAGNPWNAMRDLRKTQTMGVYATEDGFGTGEAAPDDNALLVDTGITWPYGSLDGKPKRVLANDLFRAVHDAFGHGMEGAGFRARGEENAWQAHVRLFTGSAVGAITSETRGQNSWLNYGPHGEANRTAKVEDTVFAEQKTGLMPEWTWTEGRVGDSDTRLSRRINKLGLYSALEEQVDALTMKSAPTDGWKASLRGMINAGKVKADEVEWSGVMEWLDLQKGKVTHDQIVEYLKQGGVQIEETVRSNAPTLTDEEVEREYRRIYGEPVTGDGERMQLDEMREMVLSESLGDARARGTKYGNYTLPGGDNYREVLLTLPSRAVMRQRWAAYDTNGYSAGIYDSEAEARDAVGPDGAVVRAHSAKTGGSAGFRSSHWDEPNVLAHIRTKDRTDADGKRVLFVEEIQSDWAQEGRKKGFKSDRSAQVIEDERNELVRKRNALLEEAANLPDSEMRRFKSAMAEADALRQRISELDQEHDRVLARGQGVPRAPFVQNTDSWVTLALKRIITMAVQEGHDRVAFVTGVQSADRYDLSREVGGVYYTQNGVGKGSLVATERGKTINDSRHPVLVKDDVAPEDLANYIGKEVAEKLMQQEPDAQGFRGIAGDGLKLGGAGMRSFYDKIVPSALKKLLPKLGGSLSSAEVKLQDLRQEGALDTRYPLKSQQLAFDITPEMKEKVGQGVPLFSRKLPAKSGSQPTMMDAWRQKVGDPAWNKVVATVKPLLAAVKLADTVPTEFKRQMRAYRAEIQREARAIKEVAERASGLSPQERIMLSDFIERVMAPGTLPPSHIVDIATAVRAALEAQREELISMRMLSEDTRDRWGDEYIARYYAKHVIDKPWDKALRAAHKKIDGSHLRGRGMFEPVKRADIPKFEALGWEVRNDEGGDQVTMWRDFTREEREKMGEIRDGVYRFVRGYLESSRDIATGHLFEQMAQASYTRDTDPGTGDYVEVPKTVIGGMTKGMTWQMKRNPQGKFAPLVAYRYGKLAGKWVPRDIWEQLAPMFEPRGTLINAYLKGLSLWKEGKTVLNPVVHSNNIVSNVVSAYWALGPAGLSPATYKAVMADYKSKGRYYQEAVDNGLFGTEYYASEIAALMPDLQQQAALPAVASGKVSKLLTMLSGKLKLAEARAAMQRAYEAEDQFFKLMLYREARLNGATVDEAIDFAERYVFNYSDIPAGVRIAKNTAWPFASYTYKAIPMVARTMLQHPERMLATFLLFAGVNWLSFAMLGDEGDEDEERKVMPEYMRGNTAVGAPKNIRMPLNFESGAAMYMDISRRLPLGDLYDVTNQAGGLALPAPLMPNNPLFTLSVGILANKDMFSGDEIVPEYDQDFPVDKYSALGGYFARQVMPNNPLIPGSYSWNKVMNGIAGSTGEEFAGYSGMDYRGRMQSFPRAVLDTMFGVKLREVDVDTERQKRMSNQARLASDVKADIRRAGRDQSMTEQQREQRIQDLTTKIQRIMEKTEEFK